MKHRSSSESPVSTDEERIAERIREWHGATAAGDVSAVLRLMAEDVLFLAPGQPPMDREAFERGLRAVLASHRVVSTGNVKEIRVLGSWAYVRSELSVTMTPRDGGSSRRRAGPVLSIFRKELDESWVLVRDANMLAPDPRST